MTSLWLDRSASFDSDELPEGDVDDVVVGAGITGLTTALLLVRAGRRVVVVEARHVGAGATGSTTAKVSVQHGTKLAQMLRHSSRHLLGAYVDGNQEGLAWLLRFCDDHGVAHESRPSVVYAAAPEELDTVRREHEAEQALGLRSQWVDTLEVPFPFHGGTLLPDQAQLDPMELLAALVGQVRSHGGSVVTGRRVTGVSWSSHPTVRLDDGHEIRAADVVLATGTPILDRGLYFAKLEARRSYLLALEADDVPAGMFLSAGSSSRSVRDVPGGGVSLLVGGNGHVVGRVRSEEAHVDELRAWASTHFPGSVERHAWSAQDYASHDGYPYVGALPRGRGRIHVATGFDKWGMTNGVAAARNVAGRILGSTPRWASVVGHRLTRPQGALTVLRRNAGVGLAGAQAAVAAESHAAPSSLAEGEGDVGRGAAAVPTAVSRTDGTTCAVVGVCTHLGGVLRWNDAERSWDCPLHGSRFASDGEVLEGPAVKPLATRPSR